MPLKKSKNVVSKEPSKPLDTTARKKPGSGAENAA